MQWQLLFVSVPPIIAYMLFWVRGQPRTGVVAALVVGALELTYNSFQLDLVEPFSLLSLVLLGLFGGLSLRGSDDRFFKLQPVAFELVCAGVLIYYNCILETSLLPIVAEKYLGLHDVLPAYQRGYATVYATTLSRSLPYLLLVHAGLTAYGAWARSTWWWFNVRVFGFYGMLAALFVAERLLGITA